MPADRRLPLQMSYFFCFFEIVRVRTGVAHFNIGIIEIAILGNGMFKLENSLRVLAMGLVYLAQTEIACSYTSTARNDLIHRK